MDTRYNNLLSEATLIVEEETSFFGDSPEPGRSVLFGLGVPRGHAVANKLRSRHVAAALELYLRRMLEACAQTVRIPAHGGTMWASPTRLKSLLAASSRKRLRIVDRRHSIWNAIERYLQPVSKDYADASMHDALSPNMRRLREITWSLYLLALGTRDHCEVPLDPKTVTFSIDSLDEAPLSAESKIRLSSIRGIFRLFSHNSEVPGFRCIALPNVTLRERIDEILEDAYLLEASQLRRFFGVQANITSVKRDLGKILRFIVRSRPWAKGVLEVASTTIPLVKTPSEISAKLLGVLPGLRVDDSAPILIEPDPHAANMNAFGAVTSRREAFCTSETWSVTFRPQHGPSTTQFRPNAQQQH